MHNDIEKEMRRAKRNRAILIGCICLACILLVAAAVYFMRGKSVENIDILSGDTKIGKYSGRVDRNGLMNGKGTLTLTDGTVCSGEWDNGELTGEYDCVFPNGSTYSGALSADYRPEGHGIFTYLSGETAEGDWTWGVDVEYSDKFNMKNILYTGMMLDNTMTGYGKASSVSTPGYYYIGEFRNDMRDGMVERVAVDIYILRIQCSEGKALNDTATFEYYSGEGESVSGVFSHSDNKSLKNGPYAGYTYYGLMIDNTIVFGTLTFPDGSEYCGTFVDGYIKADTAEYTRVNGEEIELTDVSWVVNEKTNGTTDSGDSTTGLYTGMKSGTKKYGYGEYTWESTNTYTGELIDGEYGYGTFCYNSGDVYTGHFENGKRNGEGKMVYAGGDVYEGLWVDGKREDSNGILRQADGDVFEGKFENGSYTEGKWTYASGNTFDVHIDHGNSSYTGVFTWKATGSSLDGKMTYNDGSISYANGTFNFKNGTHITGEFVWVNDLAWLGGSYDGYTLNGIPTGYGTLTYANGEKFKGEFGTDGLPVSNGVYPSGVYFSADGEELIGEFVDGVFQKCQVSMTAELNGILLKDNGEYKVVVGDEIVVNAESTEASISFIGYNFISPDEEWNKDDIIDIKGGQGKIVVPQGEIGSKVTLYVEPVATNDNGEPTLITKTGWQKYILEYVDPTGE